MGLLDVVSSLTGGDWLRLGASALTGYSAYSTAQAQKQAAQANIGSLQQESAFQQERTGLELERFKRKAFEEQATRLAIASKAGRPLEGTVAALMKQQDIDDALDAEIIRRGGDITSSRYASEIARQSRAKKVEPMSTLLAGGAQALKYWV
jgi:hypothetical protein